MMRLEFGQDNLLVYNDDGLLPMPTSKGRMALHLTVESKQDEFVIDVLLQMDLNGLLSIDPITTLPPFTLAAVDENNTLDTVYSLLHEHPSFVQCMTR